MDFVVKAIVYAFTQCDLFSQGVIVALGLLSLYSWYLMLGKWVELGTAVAVNRKFLDQYRLELNIMAMVLRMEQFQGAPLVEIYRGGLKEVMDVLQVDPRHIDGYCRSQRLPRPLTDNEIDRVQATMERVVADKILELEEGVPKIATVVSLSPFMGLLGTVFGITMTFCAIAMSGGRMELSKIAPGIAGALLTTAAGLVVAIPALIGHGILSAQLRESMVGMENFIDEFITQLRLQNQKSAGE